MSTPDDTRQVPDEDDFDHPAFRLPEWRARQLASARACETHRAVELLILTLDVARDLADHLSSKHGHGCGCDYCTWDEDAEQVMEAEMPGVWWALLNAHAALDGRVVVKNPHDPDGSFNEAFRELARRCDALWPDDEPEADAPAIVGN